MNSLTLSLSPFALGMTTDHTTRRRTPFERGGLRGLRQTPCTKETNAEAAAAAAAGQPTDLALGRARAGALEAREVGGFLSDIYGRQWRCQTGNSGMSRKPIMQCERLEGY